MKQKVIIIIILLVSLSKLFKSLKQNHTQTYTQHTNTHNHSQTHPHTLLSMLCFVLKLVKAEPLIFTCVSIERARQLWLSGKLLGRKLRNHTFFLKNKHCWRIKQKKTRWLMLPSYRFYLIFPHFPSSFRWSLFLEHEKHSQRKPPNNSVAFFCFLLASRKLCTKILERNLRHQTNVTSSLCKNKKK